LGVVIIYYYYYIIIDYNCCHASVGKGTNSRYQFKDVNYMAGIKKMTT